MTKSLGISFSSNNIHFTELSRDNGYPKLENAESVKVDFDFEDELGLHKGNQKELTNISSEIAAYVTKRNLQEASVSLSIGTSQAFLITLPIDFSEGRHTVNKNIYWELSNYFPDNYNDFVINTYRLNNPMPAKSSDEFLIIAVKKNTIEFIKRIFKVCGLKLALVDIDHFSAEHAIRKSYENILEGKKALLVGLKKNRVDYGLLDDKKYKFYTYSKFNSEPERKLNLSRKLGSMFLSNPLLAGIDMIYVYGEEIKEDVIDVIRKLDKAPVEITNPFGGIRASELFLKDENIRKNSCRYAASCGAALRNIN
ncbi:MAG: pilus assembly protein PilM [Chlorobi bacterium]|nr:pilus assembly protein PilM [Chlorobiota bacterium]